VVGIFLRKSAIIHTQHTHAHIDYRYFSFINCNREMYVFFKKLLLFSPCALYRVFLFSDSLLFQKRTFNRVRCMTQPSSWEDVQRVSIYDASRQQWFFSESHRLPLSGISSLIWKGWLVVRVCYLIAMSGFFPKNLLLFRDSVIDALHDVSHWIDLRVNLLEASC